MSQREMAVQIWHAHNKPGHHCAYVDARNLGLRKCPADVTVEEWLESFDFDKAMEDGEPVDLDVDIVNRQSHRTGERPKSIAELREEHASEPWVDEGVYRRAREASESDETAPVINEQESWVPEALDYFKDRLDKQDEAFAALAEVLRGIHDGQKEIGKALGHLVGAVEIIASLPVEEKDPKELLLEWVTENIKNWKV
jgi:hypothetical protein